MRHLKPLAVMLGIILILLALLVGFFGDPSQARCRQIAADLIELHRQWHTNDNTPALFQSLTNLPFQDGAAGAGKAWVYHRYSILGIKWQEYFFIQQPLPVTTASEWTLYHAYYWNRPSGGQKELAMRKLLTTTAK
jgi:hypothetical protein